MEPQHRAHRKVDGPSGLRAEARDNRVSLAAIEWKLMEVCMSPSRGSEYSVIYQNQCFLQRLHTRLSDPAMV